MDTVYAMLSFLGGCVLGFLISIPSWVVMMSIMAYFGDTYGSGRWLSGLSIVPFFTVVGGFIAAHYAYKASARRKFKDKPDEKLVALRKILDQSPTL